MNYQLRRALSAPVYIGRVLIDMLHESKDADSVVLSSIITAPMLIIDAYELLRDDGRPVARLYASLVLGSWCKKTTLDHPLADYYRSRTKDDLVRAAKKWNDPFLWDKVMTHLTGCPKQHSQEAARSGSAHGNFYYALSEDMTMDQRNELYREPTWLDWENMLRYFLVNRHGLSTFYVGRLLCAIGLPHIRPECSKFYSGMRVSMRQATITWLVVAKRLGVCRDVARLIGRDVFNNPVLYERIPFRSSKRLKR